MSLYRSTILFASLFVCLFASNAQMNKTPFRDKLELKIESAGVFTTGDNAPFWVTNNNYGIGWSERNNQYIRTGVFADKSFSNNSLKLSFGADALIANNFESDIYIQQLYVDINYWNVGLSIGQKERTMPFLNNSLSSGSMVLSNNIRPIPQAEFGTLGFIALPFTNNSLHFMGGFSFGYYTDNKYRKKVDNKTYMKDVLYHHKYGYLKYEKPESQWNMIVGLDGGAQWGGERYTDGKYNYSDPNNISDLFRIFINARGGRNANPGDQENKLGDSYGSYVARFNYKLKNKSSFTIYYEHFFEDRSGMLFYNFPDGTYGIEYNVNERQLISGFLFEYIYSKNQSGHPKYDSNGNRIWNKGADNYYNNGMYVSNQNYGFTIGNPIFTSPYYNKGKHLMISDNRLSAYHLGISGWFNKYITYKTLLTISYGYGTPFEQFGKRRDQFMSQFGITYNNPQNKEWLFSGSLAYDNTQTIIGKNFGGQIKIAKIFTIR